MPAFLQDPLTISVVKGYKTDFNYFGLKTNLKKFLQVRGAFLDVSLGHVFKRYSKTDIQGQTEVRIKYKHSSIDRREIPKGFGHKLSLKHSLFSALNVYSLKYDFKKFLQSNHLSKVNFELDGGLLLTNETSSLNSNLRGLKTVIYFPESRRSLWQQYLSLKMNFFTQEALEAKKMNFFLYFSQLGVKGHSLALRYGFGVEKHFEKMFNFELCYELFTNQFQL